MDSIHLKGMRFYGYHGVFAEETRLGQHFVVSTALYLDVSEAGKRDDLTLTVNYAHVYERIKAIVQEERFLLIEALAERIASVLLDTYTIVKQISVEVVKPNPPFEAYFEGVSVQITRTREQG